MKFNKNKQNVQGFTLLEVMIVIAILGILAALAAPKFNGYMESAEARAISSTINTVDNEIKQLAKIHRISNCSSGTRLTNTSNNYLDVLYAGSSMVLSAQRSAYDRLPHANYTKLFSEVTAAVSGTSAGVYEIESMPFTLQTCTANENVYRVANVRTSVLAALLEAEYPRIAASFVAATAVTTGPVRYDAADSNEEHQVDFYIAR